MTTNTLTDSDLTNVNIALTTFADFGDILLKELREEAPPVGSQFGVWNDTFDTGSGAGHVRDGFLSINAAVLSGADHLRGLNTLASTGTTSSVTVARGAVEAYAHAFHLATAPTVEKFVERSIWARHAEYNYPMKHSATMTNHVGDLIDPEQERLRLEAELVRLNLKKPTRTDIAAKVGALLDEATAQTSGKHVYSGLSSIAHAELTGVGAFIAVSDDEVVGLDFDRETLMNLVFITTAAAETALEAVVNLFGNQTAQRFVFDETRRIVSEARATLTAPGTQSV